MKINLYSEYKSFPSEWLPDVPGELNIYVDKYVREREGQKNCIALLVEPRAIIPEIYTFIESNYHSFRYIFTFDSQLLEKLPNAKLLLYGQISVDYSHQDKTKGISMICSKKQWCKGHRYRHMIAHCLKGEIDTFGEFDGGAWVEDLNEIYNPYRFNVAVENYSDGHYFTEKICNCFATMTVPIYYGSPKISEYFDPGGIMQCSSPEDVIRKTRELLAGDIEKEYSKRMDAILRNYALVRRYKRYAPLFLEVYEKLFREEFGG